MIIPISINNKIHLGIRDIPNTILHQIKDELTILNPEWLRKKKAGIFLGNTDRRIWFYEEQGSNLILPRGFIKPLTKLLSPYNPSYRSKDNTRLLDDIIIHIKLIQDSKWNFQDTAVDHIMEEPSAVLNFPTGGGKTVTGIKLICLRKQPTLIVVHSRELLFQWKNSLLKFTDLQEKDIGLIGSGKNSTGIITIGIINSLYEKIDKIKHMFGQVIIDEVHRLPGKCFKEVVGKMDCYYILGLSATPKRGDSQTKVIFFYCGEQEYEIKPPELMNKGVIVKPKLIIRLTDFEFDPANGQTCLNEGNIGEDFNKLDKKCSEWLYILDKLIKDKKRNELIIKDILAYVSNTSYDKIPLIISDRIEHCLELEKLLKEKSKSLIVETLTSLTSNKKRKDIVQKVKEGKIHVLISGCKLIGEGFDCKYLSTIFLTTPISFDGRLVQYIGRILRFMEGKEKAKIYDYLDDRVPMLRRSFNKRKKGYRHMGIKM